MTCQNQSIYDSDAEFSNDIKKIVKQKLQEGESERDIKKFLAERYGEYILFRPLMNYNNIFIFYYEVPQSRSIEYDQVLSIS